MNSIIYICFPNIFISLICFSLQDYINTKIKTYKVSFLTFFKHVHLRLFLFNSFWAVMDSCGPWIFKRVGQLPADPFNISMGLFSSRPLIHVADRLCLICPILSIKAGESINCWAGLDLVKSITIQLLLLPNLLRKI